MLNGNISITAGKRDVLMVCDSCFFNSLRKKVGPVTPVKASNHNILVSCLRSNLSIKVPVTDSKGGMGVSFQFRHPKDARACNRPQSGQRPVDRHKEFPSLWKHCSWGCSIICKIMVPFHDLWTDGGETEKRPPCPPRVLEPTQNYGSYFWNTTIVSGLFWPDSYVNNQ